MKHILILLIGILLSVQSQALLINGAGASFPAPIYSKWFLEFQKQQNDVRINYQSIGSGAGITQVISQTVDFGASDAPMKEEEMKKSAVPILHIPTVMGAVTVSYNLPDYQGELKLTPELLVAIFLGQIKTWDDPQLLSLNPNLSSVTNKHILVVQRSDGSGTTSIFTEYLSKVSADWKEKVGEGKSVSWPTGLGGKGNEGVSGVIKQNPGAIGYVELTFALANSLRTAVLKNAAGQFVKADLATVTAAANGIKITDDLRMSITNSSAKMAYPISAFTYLLVPQQMSQEKGQKILDFLSWALSSG
ncbi:phosphate ABC transporter substrate-binding protein PstS, partial [bacterium]|nr:phosphate ABC transporter substrate-binding protein PstS [bacterium]